MAELELDGWTVVFDLDGTLIDTAPDLHAALNHALARRGFRTIPFEAIRSMIGLGVAAMFRKGLEYDGLTADEEAVDGLWDDFLSHYRANICRLSRPYPHVAETLDALIDAGAICSVCTNKTQGLAEEVLSGLELDRYFKSIVGSDAVANRKPSGEHVLQAIARAGGNAKAAMLVGDSQTDERAARNAGLPFIYVPFGYGPEPETSETPLTATSYADLPAIIQTVIA